MKRMIVVLNILALGIWQGAFAEEKVKEENVNTAYTLDTIVVSATRTEQEIEDAPASVTVITKEDLKKYSIETIDEALKHEAGLFVRRNTGMSDANVGVTMRGLNGQERTLILLNGMPVNEGYAGAVYWSTLGIENIERIEITRGGGSALYGGNAMGGVINIITTTPEKLEAGAHGGYGSEQTYKYGAFAGNQSNRFKIRVGYEAETTDGYPTALYTSSISSGTGTLTGGYETTDTGGNPVWVGGDKGDKNGERSNLNLMAAYDLTDSGNLRFDFQRGTVDWSNDRPNTYMTDASGNPSFSGSVHVDDGQKADFYEISYFGTPGSVEQYAGSLTYKDSFGPVGFTGRVGYQNYDTWYTYATDFSSTYNNGAGKGTYYSARTWSTDLQADISLGEKHLLTSGVYFRTDNFDMDSYNLSYWQDEDSKLDKTEITEGIDRFYAFYLQDEWMVLDPLTLYAGVRFDLWKAYDGKAGNVGSEQEFEEHEENAISPQIAGVWNPFTETYIRGSVAKAFRAPNIYELFKKWTLFGSTYYNNPNLKPETTWTYEAGIDQYVWDRKLKLSGTYFFTQANDLIGSYRVESNVYKENISKAEIQGCELEASAMPANWLNIWVNYTYTDSEVKENDRDPAIVGKHLIDYPEQTINLGLDLTYRWFKVSLAGNYLGRIYTSEQNDDQDDVYDGYSKRWLWNTKLTYSPVKYAECSFSVENIFDEEYFAISKGHERSYFFEVRFRY